MSSSAKTSPLGKGKLECAVSNWKIYPPLVVAVLFAAVELKRASLPPSERATHLPASIAVGMAVQVVLLVCCVIKRSCPGSRVARLARFFYGLDEIDAVALFAVLFESVTTTSQPAWVDNPRSIRALVVVSSMPVGLLQALLCSSNQFR
mmetsp:Transcript_57818/g.183353  ORF Transcript_57818/g.183353 Transcript_57818/m.183353 type:complete len:149 (-) Transcript_57818:224-670(-)